MTKKIVALASLLVIGILSNASADTIINSNITTNTTWNLAGSPYIVSANISVVSGVTLTIQPGVVVKFNGNYYINGDGTINAQGVSGNLIVFTSNLPSPGPGSWQFISLKTSASIIKYAKIEYADEGVLVPSYSEHGERIENCLIQYNNYGIYFEPGTALSIQSNTIVNNVSGIFAGCNDNTGCDPALNNNLIYNNTQYNLYAYSYGGNASGRTINAENNWWGTTDRAAIENGIYDRLDSSGLARVDYQPYLDGPNGNPMFDLNAPALTGILPLNQQVQLTWTAVENAAGYKIKYGTSSGLYEATVDAGSVTSYFVTGLTNATTYYFVVRAYAGTFESPNSNELSAAPVNKTFVPAVIDANTTWTLANSPYYVTSNVTVNAGVTLTIQPGVVVKFSGNYYIDGNGTINAQGTYRNLIVFTSDLPSPGPGSWQFIAIKTTASILKYAKIEYADKGVLVPSYSENNERIENCLIQYNNYGIYFEPGTSPLIQFNTIINNVRGIFAGCNSYGCNPTINYNSIFNNNQYNVYSDSYGGNASGDTINAQNNWWGTTDTAVIENSIYDRLDNWGGLARINYQPYLVGPVGRPDYVIAPTLYSITLGSQQLELFWTLITNAIGYKIKYGTSPGNYPSVLDVGNVTNYTVTGLTNDTTYYFVVSAYDTMEESPNSNEKSKTPEAVSNVPAIISQNTIWNLAGSPYIISSDVTVNNGVTLTIQPGVQVLFAGNYQLGILGTLLAQGASGNLINFTSNQGAQAPGDWKSVYLYPGTSTSVVSYCRFQLGQNALSLEGTSPIVQDSIFENNLTGIYVYKTSSAQIHDNIIQSNAQAGIKLVGEGASAPTPIIYKNTIINNNFGAYNLQTGIIGTDVDHSAIIVDAENNWWGTADPTQIALKIWDHYDESNRERVDFSPYLTSDPATSVLISNNLVTQRFFKPRIHTTTSIQYTLDVAANVTIKIYDYTANSLVRTLVNNQLRSAGNRTEIWDGKNDGASLLPDGVYSYTIDAQTTDGKAGHYNPYFYTESPLMVNVTLAPASFSPFKGDRLRIAYDLTAPALVTMGYLSVTYVPERPAPTTGNISYWDGRGNQGQIVSSGVVDAMVRGIPESFIAIADDRTLDVDVLTADPYLIRPLYNETTKVTYSISESATVTVKILSQNASAVMKVLEQSVSKAPGTYTLTWDGRTTAGETVAEAGDYRVRVEALDAYGKTTIRDGNIRIVY